MRPVSQLSLAIAVVALTSACLGSPDSERGAAGLALASAYAVRIDSFITAQHTPAGKPAEAPQEIHAAVRGILFTPAGPETEPLPGSFRLCRLDLPPAGGRQLTFRDDVWWRFADFPVTLQPAPDLASWDVAPWAILMGARGLADPVNDALPTDPSDPRVDPVEDDRPGVRIGIKVSGWSDPQIDATVRVRVPRGRLALSGDGSLVGEVDLAHDVWVWYADMPWPISDRDSAAANDYMRRKSAEWPIVAQHHDVLGLPFAGAVDCTAALAATAR